MATKNTKKSKKSKTSEKVEQRPFTNKLEKSIISDNTPDVKLINKGQYKEAFDLLEDAEACQLTPMLIGPPGTGKTMLARSYAASKGRAFEWLTLDESTKPAHLIGAFDPAETIRRGFVHDAFSPGPMLEMMVEGGYFLANELNRATEYTQNSFLEPLEERTIVVPRVGRIKANDEFFMICAANPGDMAGTHRISEALKDRIKVWIRLDYPTRSVEMEIIKANIPQIKVSKDYLTYTHDLIMATRNSKDIERPASIRSAVAIAKLAGVREDNGDLSLDQFRDLAHKVLSGGIKAKPGQDEERIAKRIISSVVR